MTTTNTPFNPGLNIGDVIDNNRLCAVFQCSPQGGMRRAIKTSSLVIVSDHVQSIYDDRWIHGTLHYTGMGRKGDQSVTSTQNRTLAESGTNQVAVFLFEVFRQGQYTFCGQVQLAGEPYQETQCDEDGIARKVWIFPLSLIGTAVQPKKADVEEAFRRKERRARSLTDEELRQRALHAKSPVGQRALTGAQFYRDPWVAEYARRRAAGKCDLCKEKAPFSSKNGLPYLECHHIEWLAKGGSDTVANTVALCPNCHRKMHILDRPVDRHHLMALNLERE